MEVELHYGHFLRQDAFRCKAIADADWSRLPGALERRNRSARHALPMPEKSFLSSRDIHHCSIGDPAKNVGRTRWRAARGERAAIAFRSSPYSDVTHETQKFRHCGTLALRIGRLWRGRRRRAAAFRRGDAHARTDHADAHHADDQDDRRGRAQARGELHGRGGVLSGRLCVVLFARSHANLRRDGSQAHHAVAAATRHVVHRPHLPRCVSRDGRRALLSGRRPHGQGGGRRAARLRRLELHLRLRRRGVLAPLVRDGRHERLAPGGIPALLRQRDLRRRHDGGRFPAHAAHVPGEARRGLPDRDGPGDPLHHRSPVRRAVRRRRRGLAAALPAQPQRGRRHAPAQPAAIAAGGTRRHGGQRLHPARDLQRRRDGREHQVPHDVRDDARPHRPDPQHHPCHGLHAAHAVDLAGQSAAVGLEPAAPLPRDERPSGRRPRRCAFVRAAFAGDPHHADQHPAAAGLFHPDR